MKLTQTDVRFLRLARREFGSKTAWATFAVACAVLWFREDCLRNDLLKVAGCLAVSVALLYLMPHVPQVADTISHKVFP